MPFGIKAAVMLEILSHTVPPRAPELSQAAITAPSVLAVSERPLDGEFSVPKKHIHIVVRLLPPPHSAAGLDSQIESKLADARCRLAVLLGQDAGGQDSGRLNAGGLDHDEAEVRCCCALLKQSRVGEAN